MVEEPVQSLCRRQIANNVGIVTINNSPVNSLSRDVCDKPLESFDEFEKAHAFAITPVKIGISYNTAGMSHFMGVLPCISSKRWSSRAIPSRPKMPIGWGCSIAS